MVGTVVLILIIFVALTYLWVGTSCETPGVLLMLLGMVMAPALFINSSARLVSEGYSRFRHIHCPDIIRIGFTSSTNPHSFVLPILVAAVIWAFLLMLIGMKEGGNRKEWLRNHSIITALWSVCTAGYSRLFVRCSTCDIYRDLYSGMHSLLDGKGASRRSKAGKWNRTILWQL